MHQQGNILYWAALCASFQNQKNSTEVRGSGHDETNARASLERGNVPKSLILKGRASTETNYTIVRGTKLTCMDRYGLVVWKLVTQSVL